MVNTIPVRFKRVAAAFDEMARLRSCESSGSEHSADLSDLVNSFFESEIRDRKIKCDGQVDGRDHAVDDEVNGTDETEINSPDQIEIRDSLSKLLSGRENDVVRRSIRAEVEAAMGDVSGDSENFKRRLMTRLRSRGFDAGLCKSKWEKNGRNGSSGTYEYIDVNAGDSRHIIEVNLGREFTIARPTDSYTALLEIFPQIFVGSPEDLKQVIKLMSRAIRKSMKSAELKMPPWRRLHSMQAKWFGFYRRTSNETPTEKAAESLAGNRLVGFVPVTGTTPSLYCRGEIGTKNRGMISSLAAALK